MKEKSWKVMEMVLTSFSFNVVMANLVFLSIYNLEIYIHIYISIYLYIVAQYWIRVFKMIKVKRLLRCYVDYFCCHNVLNVVCVVFININIYYHISLQGCVAWALV